MNTVQDEWFFLRSFRFMHMSLHDPIHGKFYQKKSKYRTHVLGNFPISFFINVESVLSLFLGSNLVGEIFLTKPKWQWKSTVCAHVYIEHIITYTSVKYCICCLENDLWCLMVLLCRFAYVQFIFCFYFSLSSDPKKKKRKTSKISTKIKHHDICYRCLQQNVLDIIRWHRSFPSCLYQCNESNVTKCEAFAKC